MKKIVLASIIAAAFVATPVLAQGYVGLGVGSSSASGIDQTSGAVSLTSSNNSRTSVKIFGGFKFTPNWGLEAQYADLGNRDFVIRNGAAQVGSGNVKLSQFSLAGTGTLPLASNFSVFGKLGASNNSGKVNAAVPVAGVTFNDSGNKTDLMVGVGLTYAVTPQIAVRAEYEDFGKFNNNSGNSIRVNNFSIGLQYSF